MKTLGPTLKVVVIAALCALLASCAGAGTRQAARAAQDTPGSTDQGSNNSGGGPKPALTIQAGEGEKLNLPWFVRDAQDWVNGDPTSP